MNLQRQIDHIADQYYLLVNSQVIEVLGGEVSDESAMRFSTEVRRLIADICRLRMSTITQQGINFYLDQLQSDIQTVQSLVKVVFDTLPSHPNRITWKSFYCKLLVKNLIAFYDGSLACSGDFGLTSEDWITEEITHNLKKLTAIFLRDGYVTLIVEGQPGFTPMSNRYVRQVRDRIKVLLEYYKFQNLISDDDVQGYLTTKLNIVQNRITSEVEQFIRTRGNFIRQHERQFHQIRRLLLEALPLVLQSEMNSFIVGMNIATSAQLLLNENNDDNTDYNNNTGYYNRNFPN